MLSGPEVLDRAEQLTTGAVHGVQSGTWKASASGEAAEQGGGLDTFASFVSEATANITDTCSFKPKLGLASVERVPGTQVMGLVPCQGTSTVGVQEEGNQWMLLSHVNICPCLPSLSL